MREFSVFEYCYRDASNYKSWGFLLLRGVATSAEIAMLKNRFDAGCYFIAEQLGLPPLYSELWTFSNGPTADDHVWHTFHVLCPATAKDIAKPVFCALKDLVKKVSAIETWDETLSPHWGL